MPNGHNNADGDFDPRDYFPPVPPKVEGKRADIFGFAPENCDACALWLRFGGGDMLFSWQAFAGQLEGLPQGRVCQLRLNERQPIAPITIGPASRPWRNPLGNLVRIDPPLNRLRLIFFIPNLDDTFVSEPAQARSSVMAALETLNEAGAENVAMNGIQGHPRELDERIRTVMVDAVRDWFEMEHHRSELSIRHVDLVDLRGGFNGVQLA